jgi:hypothetical protein
MPDKQFIHNPRWLSSLLKQIAKAAKHALQICIIKMLNIQLDSHPNNPLKILQTRHRSQIFCMPAKPNQPESIIQPEAPKNKMTGDSDGRYAIAARSHFGVEEG